MASIPISVAALVISLYVIWTKDPVMAIYVGLAAVACIAIGFWWIWRTVR